jgi:hypothetical protein
VNVKSAQDNLINGKLLNGISMTLEPHQSIAYPLRIDFDKHDKKNLQHLKFTPQISHSFTQIEVKPKEESEEEAVNENKAKEEANDEDSSDEEDVWESDDEENEPAETDKFDGITKRDMHQSGEKQTVPDSNPNRGWKIDLEVIKTEESIYLLLINNNKVASEVIMCFPYENYVNVDDNKSTIDCILEPKGEKMFKMSLVMPDLDSVWYDSHVEFY